MLSHDRTKSRDMVRLALQSLAYHGMEDLPFKLLMLYRNVGSACKSCIAIAIILQILQLRAYFLSQILGQKSIKTTIHIFLHVFLYIEDVNCCGDAPIASLAQLSSNVESQIEVKRKTVVSWWNHNSSFLSAFRPDQFGTVGCMRPDS